MKENIKRKIYASVPSNMPPEKWEEYCNEISQNLGWFIITFNNLDELITLSTVDLLSKAIEKDFDLHYIAVHDRTFSQKAKSLKHLIIYYKNLYSIDEYMEKTIDLLFKRINDLNAVRNNYIHADWYNAYEEKGIVNVKMLTKPDKTGSYFHYDFNVKPGEIMDNEELIEKASDELSNIIEKIESIILKNRAEKIK